MSTRQDLLEAIYLTGKYYGREIEKPLLRMFADDFDGQDYGRIIQAYGAWRKNPANSSFPRPAQIMAMLNPQLSPRQEAIRTIDVVKRAITKFGWPQPDKARAELGESTWAIVERLGGWQRVCEDPDLYLDNPTVYAQTRDKVEAQVTSIRTGINYDRLPGSAAALKLEQGQSEPMSIGEILKLAKPKEPTND